MPRTNRTRYTILGVLTRGPMTGYDIKRYIEISVGNFWRESYGQIYPTLRSLAEDGLVRRQTRQQHGKPGRQIYSITRKGRKELREWLALPAELEVPRVEVLLKLFFGAAVAPGVSLQHVRDHREQYQQKLALLTDLQARLRDKMRDSPSLPFWLLCARQGTLVCEAVLKWCDEAERTLKKLPE